MPQFSAEPPFQHDDTCCRDTRARAVDVMQSTKFADVPDAPYRAATADGRGNKPAPTYLTTRATQAAETPLRVVLYQRSATEDLSGLLRQEAEVRQFVSRYYDSGWSLVQAHTDQGICNPARAPQSSLSPALAAADNDEFDVLAVDPAIHPKAGSTGGRRA